MHKVAVVFAVQKLIGLEDELVPANLRSEVEGLALIFGIGGSGFFLHRHQANRIYRHSDDYLSMCFKQKLRCYGLEADILSMTFRTSCGPSSADCSGREAQTLLGMRSALR